MTVERARLTGFNRTAVVAMPASSLFSPDAPARCWCRPRDGGGARRRNVLGPESRDRRRRPPRRRSCPETGPAPNRPKWNVMPWPLSATRRKAVLRPSIFVTCGRGKRATVPKTFPVRRWHSMQWQIAIRTGSPSQVMRSCPQQQWASRVGMAMPQSILKAPGAGGSGAGVGAPMGRPTNCDLMPAIQRWARSLSLKSLVMSRPRVMRMPRSAPL